VAGILAVALRYCSSRIRPMRKIVAVIGPTGTGKTALGAALASRFGGEIVSVDSKQVFRGMDIGTAKEKNLPIPQHLIDIVEPGEKVSVAWFQARAYSCIDRLLDADILPVLVGASMLYAEAVINGYLFPATPVSRQKVLSGQDGQAARAQQPRYQTLKLGIRLEREVLRQRLEQRTREWLEAGLVEEIRGLLDRGVSVDWLRRCGQEYRYFTQYLLGELTQEDAITRTNRSLMDYAKRQYTWWRRHPDLCWVTSRPEAEERVEAFLREGVQPCRPEKFMVI
jgi:tRNA dimethylallyltransferase